MDLSVVIPIYNEAPNLEPLCAELDETLRRWGRSFEVLLVDDGSIDDSVQILSRIVANNPHFKVIQLRRNFGQTAAFAAGFALAQGQLIATSDGDLQNDPNDIVPLARHLLDQDLDVVAGWRKRRQDTFLTRRLPSMLANRLIGRLTGVRLHDYGCTLKVFRAAVLKQVPLFGEMHRFIPAWLVTVIQVRRIAELPVKAAAINWVIAIRRFPISAA